MPSILVTGAGRGIGYELTRVFLENDWQVFPLVRSPEPAEECIGLNPTGCRPIMADVTSSDVVPAISGVLEANGGKLDVLVNNAGITGRSNRLSGVDTEEMKDMFDVHCLGVLRCTKAALPYLLRGERPLLVNLTSRFGSLSMAASGELKKIEVSYSYRIAKAAQNMLTLCLHQEFGSAGIRVCALHPGRVRTESGAEDATIAPQDAAEKMFEWITTIGNEAFGGFYDLISGEKMNW